MGSLLVHQDLRLQCHRQALQEYSAQSITTLEIGNPFDIIAISVCPD